MLSERLSAVADLAAGALCEVRGEDGDSCPCVADIGTDHGYLTIALVEQGIAGRAVACDVRPGPLERARLHIEASGLEDRIETRLADGLRGLAPGEAQVAVLAGMGGRLMRRILEEGRPKALGIGHLVLQPQSEPESVWAFLGTEGWRVAEERMIQEEGRFYLMARADAVDAPLGQQAPGALLSARRDGTWRLFLERELEKKRALLGSLEARGVSAGRLEELRREMGALEATVRLTARSTCR